MILNETIAHKVLNNQALINFLHPDPDPWHGHPLQGYVNKNNKVKGKYGELFVETLMTDLGHKVGKAKRSTSGHDRIINDIRVEVKFGAAHRDSKNKGKTCQDVFSFNHLSVKKDWDRAILIGVNIDNVYATWFTKQDFINELNKTSNYFKRQQSGKDGGNDDWMFMTDSLSWQSFIKEPWVKNVNQW